MSIGVVDNEMCPICGIQPETIDHLFFACDFSKQCVENHKSWIGVNWSIRILKDLIRKWRLPKAKLRLVAAIFSNLV